MRLHFFLRSKFIDMFYIVLIFQITSKCYDERLQGIFAFMMKIRKVVNTVNYVQLLVITCFPTN